MPRVARPSRPPGLPRTAQPTSVPAEALASFAGREGRRLVVPVSDLAERIRDTLARHLASPERLPAPSATLRWLDASDQTAGALLGLLADAAAVTRLAPSVAPDDLAAVERLRAALAGARWQHIARAVVATGGRPRTGRAETRAALTQVAGEVFDPPVTGAAARRFVRLVLDAGNGGQLAPGYGCARRGSVSA